ncbi:retinol dehydrogenase 14-like [Liolophura sinensis]|uniref:retinol dehydrogenase 14-like n=1 Tax=Liolophura sinensis TaxID=3198878 RepID=UPI00315803F9
MAWLKIVAAGTVALSVYFLRRFVVGKACASCRSLKGKTVIITGANCGLGKATACELAKREARVILACRDIAKGQAALNEIRQETSAGELIVKRLDLASLRSIREFTAEILVEEDRVDILVNNAGVFQCPYSKTEDGFEQQMGVNHFGHFLLTTRLLNMIKTSAPSRIVIVSSVLMKNGQIDFSDVNKEKFYDKKQAYADSKLAEALFCRELAHRLENSGVGVFCVSPGMVLTSLGRHVTSPLMSLIFWPLARLLLKTPHQGCQTVLHCCLSEDLDEMSGLFFRDCSQVPWYNVVDEATAKKLWELSEQLTAAKSAKP